MIFFVTNINESQCVCSHAPRIVELAVGRSLCAKCSQESARWIQYLDTMIVSIRNYILADAINSYPGQTIEFSVAVAILAELLDIYAIRIEHLDTAPAEFRT